MMPRVSVLLPCKVVDGPGQGIVAALNAGVLPCAGNLIARMDADDVARPSRFEKQVRAFDTVLAAVSGEPPRNQIRTLLREHGRVELRGFAAVA
jgi:glycosyltransferase involved in cell wall biosynthesis